jgi:hypothetical protein
MYFINLANFHFENGQKVNPSNEGKRVRARKRRKTTPLLTRRKELTKRTRK